MAQSPAAGAFAVRRFEPLEFELADATGIAPASLRLTIANGAPLTVASPGIGYAAGVLTYQNADTALGAYGATVPVVFEDGVIQRSRRWATAMRSRSTTCM